WNPHRQEFLHIRRLREVDVFFRFDVVNVNIAIREVSEVLSRWRPCKAVSEKLDGGTAEIGSVGIEEAQVHPADKCKLLDVRRPRRAPPVFGHCAADRKSTRL